MQAKVSHVIELVRGGYDLAGVTPSSRGGVAVRLRRGSEQRSVAFAHYEVPALLHECIEVGVAK